MANYFFTNKAVEDLTLIYEYTYEFWSENQADKYYKEIIECCQLLSEYPTIGRVYEEINFSILGFLINKHILFYRIINSEEIEIIRILGAEMDLKFHINI